MTKVAYPPEVAASIQTAKELAGADFVNLRAGIDYLTGCHPDYFPTEYDKDAAADLITGADDDSGKDDTGDDPPTE